MGDYSKAKKKLGWQPRTKFQDLVSIMVEADVKKVEKEIKEGRLPSSVMASPKSI